MTTSGPHGLLKAERKKCLHIHTANGFHPEKNESYTVSYFNFIMNYMGIENIESIVIECGDAYPETSGTTIVGSLRKAKAIAKDF